MLYAIGTSSYNLIRISKQFFYNYNYKNGESPYMYITLLYNIIQSECTLFNNEDDAKDILKGIKNKDNIVKFKNKSIFSEIEEFDFDNPKPKIEDLKIYRLNVEEVE